MCVREREKEDQDALPCPMMPFLPDMLCRTQLPRESERERETKARIAQLVAYRLGTGEVPGSNPGKGENFSMKISY